MIKFVFISSKQPQQSLVCNPNGCLQGYLTNGQLDQQSLFNRNTMNPFQEPNDSTMVSKGFIVQVIKSTSHLDGSSE